MEWSDKIAAVNKMQRYINAHFHEKITLENVSRAAGYSKYHAVRIFKELTGTTPFETIRALRLTNAAQMLQSPDNKVVDVALDNAFESHDGFTRAFQKRFNITPQKYQSETPPVNWFIPHSIEAYYIERRHKPDGKRARIRNRYRFDCRASCAKVDFFEIQCDRLFFGM